MPSPSRPSPQLILLLAATGFASAASMRICDPMLPALAKEFAVPLSAVSPVVGLFSLTYGAMMIVFGPVGDRLGKLPVIVCSALLAGVASLICAAAGSLDALILARVLAGGATAAIIPLSFAAIGDRVPYEERQVTIARVVSGSSLGIVFGQTLGGVLVDTLGWRYAFIAQAALFLVPALLLARLVFGGALPKDAPVAVAGPALADLIAGYRGIFADRWARRILLTVGLEGFLCFGALAFLPTLMHERFGIALWQAGLATALYGIGGFGYTLLARRLVSRFSERRLVRIGWFLMSLSLVGIVLSPFWPLSALFCLSLGVGFYCQHATLQANGTQMVPERRGMAIACFAFVYFGGQALGVAAVSVLAPGAGFTTVFVVIAVALAALGATLESALGDRQGEGHALGK